ncbi:Subtilase family protein [Arabidopsis thaliana]|uniref:Subtilase family protein n=1 Tax=Arabidopsis thaliana TaxID=3702 RepID=F4KHS9_ARATH|nr:Subtilase family protein [Arabidopsis thaliana]AED97147.1 Subtilase family protein [Arabidopsis thaliana]|eukprot:NP_001190568.1 Subtilase family protein [Arabidopsis thaliana]
MAKRGAFSSFHSFLIVLLFLNSVLAVTHGHQDKQVYIVYMGSLPSRADYTPMSHHMNILQEVARESSIEGRLVRSYKRSFNGFVARLTESERERVADMEGVVSVFPNKKLKLQTSASWDFMGLKEGKGTKRNPSVESDTIIGVFDGGIWPESESFSDKGFGPPPKKWKGICAGGKNFTCNNKLIGARHYSPGDARDSTGHGTHTASIAAGNAVANTSFFGIGNGTVRGAVPASRIAVYRVCAGECRDDAILSAFDDAISDGVDIITISIGDINVYPFEKDPIAIGAFHAMSKGILTVNAAGNTGPDTASITSLAPWLLTVAASTANREFVSKVVLGDGKTLVGKSVNGFDLKGKKFPLVYGKSAALSLSQAKCAEDCTPECLDASLVKGKILVCNRFLPYVAYTKRAVAAIFEDGSDWAQINGLPVSGLQKDDFESPEAAVLKSESIFYQTAPKILSFSSRGPNIIVADILKPDITAPGLEILAANSLRASPFYDTAYVKYSVESGTSMSCPHAAGVAAYVKTFHPQWSPSMIKSAIMTTAWSMNASQSGYASTEFAYGAGHVDPIAATNPGLVYEITKTDYFAFLCGMNYNKTTVKLISGEAVTCSEKISPRNLNYPSMSAKLSGSNISFIVTFNRTVTNVGTPNSTYKSKVVLNHGSKLNVKVSPSVLSMKSMNEKQSFTVTVSASELHSELPSSANLIWSDGTHNVRSPIVVYTGDFSQPSSS